MVLSLEAAGLACLALALAVPVPTALARAQWPTRCPRAALVLWQAVGLGGGLALLSAGLTLAASSISNHWLSGVLALLQHRSRLGLVGWTGVALTLSVGVWLAVVTTVSTLRVVASRRTHRQRLDAVAEAFATAPSVSNHGCPDVRLVDHPRAVAYCLPGLRPQVVISSGAVHTLHDGELAAVLAHEDAHARGRHDLVVQPFVAWAHTFPFLRPARRAVAAVRLLVELLADDAARRSSHPDDLKRALHQLAEEHLLASRSNDAPLQHDLSVRTARLATTPQPPPLATRVAVYGAAAIVVVTPPVILLLT